MHVQAGLCEGLGIHMRHAPTDPAKQLTRYRQQLPEASMPTAQPALPASNDRLSTRRRPSCSSSPKPPNRAGDIMDPIVPASAQPESFRPSDVRARALARLGSNNA